MPDGILSSIVCWPFIYMLCAKYNGLLSRVSKSILHQESKLLIYTPVNLLHQSNAYCLIVVTPFPIVTLVKLLQWANACFQILVTLLPIVALVKLLQPSNAWFPMLATLLGISTLLKLLQPINANDPISFVFSFILQLVIFRFFASSKTKYRLSALPK